MHSITVSVVVVLSLGLLVHGIPSTLDGPFEPVTAPLDQTFRGHAIDLPDTDPRVQRTVKGWKPEQISVSLSSTHQSVWVSWITGTQSFVWVFFDSIPCSFLFGFLFCSFISPRKWSQTSSLSFWVVTFIVVVVNCLFLASRELLFLWWCLVS